MKDSRPVEGMQKRLFPTTDVTLIEVLKGADAPQAAAALNQLCQRYWAPICATLRLMGHEARDNAEDWTQEFLARFAMRQDGFGRLDKGQARLRTYLQRSLRHFVINRVQALGTQKRGSGLAAMPIQDLPEQSVPETSDAWFDRLWACEVLRRAEERLRQFYDGRTTPWEVIRPLLAAKAEKGLYETAAARLGKSADSIKMEIYRARQAFRQAIEAEVRSTIAAGVDVQDEMGHLISALAHASGWMGKAG